MNTFPSKRNDDIASPKNRRINFSKSCEICDPLDYLPNYTNTTIHDAHIIHKSFHQALAGPGPGAAAVQTGVLQEQRVFAGDVAPEGAEAVLPEPG